jgi:hypothetical protein
MDRRDLLGGLFWLAISMVVCLLAMRDEFGSFSYPGPGFFPFLSAVLLGFLAFLLLIPVLLKRTDQRKIADLWKGLEWPKAALVLSSLFVYVLLLPRLGYLLTTFGLLTLLFGTAGGTRIWVRGVNALIVTSASYLFFQMLLDMRLPKGVLGF